MIDLTQVLPGYLTTSRNIWRLVLFTAAFALIFINIYSPLGVDTWFNISKVELFFLSSLIILTGMLVVAFSRILMFQLIKKRGLRLNVGQYLLWVAAEVISMALFYALFELVFVEDARSFWVMFKVSILNTSLVLLLPYTVLWLYFSQQYIKQKLSYLKEGEDKTSLEHLTFHDEKGVWRLSMKTKDLFYLKGADNYIELIYQSKNKPMRFHLRNSMKRIEESLKNYSIIRCHRSYMVNLDKVKLIRRDSDGLKLELECDPPIDLPVSKTYMKEVFKHFGGE